MATTILLRSFAGDGDRGTAFFDASNFPHKDKLLHKKLLDGSCPSAQDLQGSMGNPPPRKQPFTVYGSTVLKSDADWKTEMSEKFTAWNDPALSVKDRLKLVHEQKVVAALGVFGPKGGPLAIAVVMNPVVTIPDGNNAATHGAPRWDTIFTSTFAKQYVDDPTVPSHCVVASLNGMSRGLLPSTRSDFMEATLPVVLTGGEFLGTKPNNGDVFSCLLLPEGCCPPVGLLWPTTTTLADFRATMENRNGAIYKGFINLLAKEEDRFQSWFTAVNNNAAPFQIRVTSAMPLWKAFLHKDQPTNTDVVDDDSLAPFRIQRERFLDSLLIDWGLYSKCKTPERFKVERYKFATWLKRADTSYPTELDLAVEVTRRPFLTHFFEPETAWPIPDLAPLLSLDDEWDVPPPYAEYEGMLISVSPGDWTAVRLTRGEDTGSLAAYGQVFGTTPTGTVTPATTTVVANGQQHTPAAPGAPTTAVTPTPPGGNISPQTRQVNFQNHGQNLLAQFGQNTMTIQGTPGMTPAGTANPFSQTQGSTPVGASRGVGHPITPSPFNFGTASPSATTQGIPSFASGTGAPNPFATGMTTNSTGISGPQQLNPWAAIAALGGIPGAAQMFTAVKNQTYTPMQHAKIQTAQDRQTCNPVLLHAALLLASPLNQTYYFQTGQMVSSDEWMTVLEPTGIGKIMLTTHDQKYKGGDDIATYLRNAVEYRSSMARDAFAGIQLPTSVKRTALPAPVQKAMYSVTSWDIGRHRRAPTIASKTWHPFHLLPWLDETYSAEVLPHNGLDIQMARQFGKLLYYAMAMLGANTDADGYDDSIFAGSFFGFVLQFICAVPQNQDLTEIWTRCPRNCTQQWMEDVCGLFELVHGMVTFRAGADYRMMGIADVHSALNPHLTALVAPQVMGVQQFSRNTIRYEASMKQLLQRYQQKWSNGVDMYASHWYAPITSAFYASAQGDPGWEYPYGGREKGNSLPPPNDTNPRKPKRARGADTKHTNSKPLFVCTAPVPMNGNPYDDVLHKIMKTGDSPLIVHPNGKSRNPICLRSAFEGYNTCATTGICQSPFQPRSQRVGRERLHVDLSDRCWSRDTYKEENWKPVVEFIKKFKEVEPTRWFKEVTPSTQWAP